VGLPFVQSLIGGSIGDAFAKIAGVFKVPPEQKLSAETELEKIRLGLEAQLVQQVTAQIEVDKEEAKSSSLFVAGWRPFIGWICGFVLAYNFIVAPLCTWAQALYNPGHPIPFPVLDYASLYPILLGMLGLGGLHAYERVQGVTTADTLKK
jgi:hypothetical protein